MRSQCPRHLPHGLGRAHLPRKCSFTQIGGRIPNAWTRFKCDMGVCHHGTVDTQIFFFSNSSPLPTLIHILLQMARVCILKPTGDNLEIVFSPKTPHIIQFIHSVVTALKRWIFILVWKSTITRCFQFFSWWFSTIFLREIVNGDNGEETEVCIRPEIVHTIMSMGPIIYFFDGRSPSRHKQ